MATRLIKWVGDPLVVDEKGEPTDWRYENRRTIVVPMLVGNAGTSRILGKADGLSRTYLWEPNTPNMTIRMKQEDWEMVHAMMPYEFKDVTYDPDPEAVRNDVFVVPAGSRVGLPTPKIVRATRGR